MKYIVLSVQKGSLTREFPILFPNDLTHLDVAQALIHGCPELKMADAVGAGEMSCTCIEPECSGCSSTLQVGSREELDNRAFVMRDYTGGIIC